MSASKLVLIDVGNTSVEFALADGWRIQKSVRLSTAATPTKAAALLKRHFPLNKVEAAVIASVVPSATASLKKVLKRLGVRTRVVGRDLKAPIANRYKKPRQVGIDRLMNAVALKARHKGPGIVIDFGTAVTFDVVSKKGEYLGGVIAPGIEISIEALYKKTALLPKIRLSRPSGILGRSTEESIRSGCAYGIGGLCDRIIEEIRKKIGPKAVVAATGGHAPFMAHYCRSIEKIYPRLVLEGILTTYRT